MFAGQVASYFEPLHREMKVRPSFLSPNEIEIGFGLILTCNYMSFDVHSNADVDMHATRNSLQILVDRNISPLIIRSPSSRYNILLKPPVFSGTPYLLDVFIFILESHKLLQAVPFSLIYSKVGCFVGSLLRFSVLLAMQMSWHSIDTAADTSYWRYNCDEYAADQWNHLQRLHSKLYCWLILVANAFLSCAIAMHRLNAGFAIAIFRSYYKRLTKRSCFALLIRRINKRLVKLQYLAHSLILLDSGVKIKFILKIIVVVYVDIFLEPEPFKYFSNMHC